VRNASRWYLAATGLLIIAHAFLGERPALTYLLAGSTIVPIAGVLRRSAPGARRPWWLLLTAMSLLTVGNGLIALPGAMLQSAIIVVITVGHATLLAAAVALVLRRGRHDIGGMLDVSVAAIGLGGVLWTALLYPRLAERHTPQGDQLAILVSVLVLAGVLGALLRVWYAGSRLPALGYLLVALGVALVGNIALAYEAGSLGVNRPAGVETLFMIAYGCVGLAMLRPGVTELMSPGPAPVDKLTNGRLVFLGLALVADPVAGGMRAMFGTGADGPLLAAGSLLVTPLVMIRVGRLARQREQAEARLRHQATHDLLTGLPNRAELHQRLDAALLRERAAGRPGVVLLFCDLNGFKQVNDERGHVAGDRLLTEVGERLREGLRAGDTVARYGGDEFVLLCEDQAQQEAAARLTACVERALTEPILLAGERVVVGCSVGAVLSDGRLGADELISAADQAMYRVKQQDRAVRTR
jgi:diguanylate cyclase (GGDEF)-like protein